ncbi:hypothetical protein ACFPM3_30245 [Streptomyces coeruleoprunus]|uniref:Uncharacterized protein n=1 Tax=Streptomyces coeruleoprunus TaxID=285563 RepID=A0ABV9XN46_9ACTN
MSEAQAPVQVQDGETEEVIVPAGGELLLPPAPSPFPAPAP